MILYGSGFEMESEFKAQKTARILILPMTESESTWEVDFAC